MNNLTNMPKVELHLHLDGSVRPQTIAELTNRNIDDIYNNVVAKEQCLDLNDYLTKFDLPNQVMQTKENLERISYELAHDLKKDGIIYAEVRFAPLKHIEKNLTKEEVIDSVLKGFNKVTDIDINIILCMMRNMTYEENKQIIDLALKYKNKKVVAIDLAGAESLYPTKDFENLFTLAKKNNIPYTIHAGEADGIESITSALNFETKRIGHGIRIIESQKLIDRIKNENVLLEICPTSNIQTNAIDKYENHPLKNLYTQNCLVSINTDNRTVSNTTLTKEYELMIKYQNFTLKDILKMNKMAINSSFANQETKNKIIKTINNYEKNI